MPPKRKSDTTGGSAVKKAHVDTSHAAAVALVNAILADPDDFDLPEDDDAVRDDLIALAKYARALQGGFKAAPAGPAKKSPEELEAAAEKLRKAAVAGIKKQMNVRLL